MSPNERDAIIAERLGRWTKRLAEAHATPLVLVGCGHDHQSGQIVLATLDEPEFDDRTVAAFLRKAAIILDPAQRRAVS